MLGRKEMRNPNSDAVTKPPSTKIIGHGIIAQGLDKLAQETNRAIIFASGVSNSSCDDQIEYDRECDLLYKTINHCKNNNLKLVYFSSAGAIYGNSDEEKDEHSPLFPISLYGKNKVFFESIIIHSGVEYLIVRLPNVVGHKQNKSQLFSALVLQAISGKANIFQNATRDLIDIDDVCDILSDIIKKDYKNEIIILASGYSTPVLDIFSEIAQVLGKKSDVVLSPGGDKQLFNNGKLNYLVPGRLKFSQDYYRHLIQKYAHTIAGDFDND